MLTHHRRRIVQPTLIESKRHTGYTLPRWTSEGILPVTGRAQYSGGRRGMDFQITEEHVRLQQRCRQLAEDFATRAALHDREATDPIENYALLRQAGFYAINVPKDLGGWGVGLLGYALAAEELAQGCPATALAFNMHPCMVGPLMESPLVTVDVKQRLASMVVQDQQLLAGNLSEAT